MRNTRFAGSRFLHVTGFVLAGLVMASCGNGHSGSHKSSSAASGSVGAMSPAAHDYLEHALGIMQADALFRSTLDWTTIRQTAFAVAAQARQPSDTYPAIIGALSMLDDSGHSQLILPHENSSDGSPTPSKTTAARSGSMGQLLGAAGYVRLPGNTVSGADSYLAALRATLARLAMAAVCGWIVDLRGDIGGDLWPMLLGLQPLLGSGTVGYFVLPGKAPEAIGLTETAVAQDGTIQMKASTFGRRGLEDAPVAVITGPLTASSGEFVRIAFTGREGAATFGRQTLGIPTANQLFPLSDGAILNLTVGRFADRSAHAYPAEPIMPGKAQATGSTRPTASSADASVRAALEWLANTKGCVQ